MKALLFLLLLGTSAACRRDKIEVRREPKDAPARSHGLTWTTPAGWKEKPGDGMRVATFELPKGPGKAEATIVALPGDVGGELANVNRWRGQLALPPIAAVSLAGARVNVPSAAGSVAVYDFTGAGKAPPRLVVGMIQVDGTLWFLKLMGAKDAVAAAKPAFLKMLQGLKPDAS